MRVLRGPRSVSGRGDPVPDRRSGRGLLGARPLRPPLPGGGTEGPLPSGMFDCGLHVQGRDSLPWYYGISNLLRCCQHRGDGPEEVTTADRVGCLRRRWPAAGLDVSLCSAVLGDLGCAANLETEQAQSGVSFQRVKPAGPCGRSWGTAGIGVRWKRRLPSSNLAMPL